VTLTPVGQGRFEIYLNGEQLYNRKEPPADVKDKIGDVRGSVSVAELVRTRLLSALEKATPAPVSA